MTRNRSGCRTRGTGRAVPARDWIWAEVNPGAPALAGDIAKMFRHEEQKAPGLMADDYERFIDERLAAAVIEIERLTGGKVADDPEV